MKSWVFSMSFLVFFATTALAEDVLAVAFHEMEPEVFYDADGKLTGFEIDLVEAIASLLKYKVHYERTPSFEDIFSRLANNKADAGISGITITEDREDSLDFSYPTQRSGLVIAVPAVRKKPDVVPVIISNLCTEEMFELLLKLVLWVFFLSVLLYFSERGKHNFPQKFWDGDSEKNGFFTAYRIIWEFMTTIGSGFKAPSTKIGYFIAANVQTICDA